MKTFKENFCSLHVLDNLYIERILTLKNQEIHIRTQEKKCNIKPEIIVKPSE